MLNSIRKGANSLIVRILLGALVGAFLMWNVANVIITQSNDSIIVKFSKAKNITKSDFEKAKAKEIAAFQQENQTHVNEEEIKNLNFDQSILRSLINESMLNYLVNIYHLDLANDIVYDYIRTFPMFKNKQGEFDIAIFRSAFGNSQQKETFYIQNFKEQILRNIISTVFSDGFQAPKIIVQNITDYMAETREIDLVQMNLEDKTEAKLKAIPIPTKSELETFYQQHKELFTIPERIDFIYLHIPKSFIQDKIKISDDEIKDHYNNNSNEFAGQSFDHMRNQLMQELKEIKFEKAMIEYAKNLEDNVAAGLNINEIAEQYSLSIQSRFDSTLSSIKQDNQELSENIDHIFKLTEGETSYPIALRDHNGFLLVSIIKRKPSNVESLEKVTKLANSLWRDNYLHIENLKIFNAIAKKYKANSKNNNQLGSLGISIDRKFLLTRADLAKHDKLPQELLTNMLKTKPNDVSLVVTANNIAYFGYIKSLSIDNKQAKNIAEIVKQNMNIAAKNGVIAELINYATKQNKMHIAK